MSDREALESVTVMAWNTRHPSIAVERLQYDGARVAYRGRGAHPVTGEQSVTLDPPEMLARLCQNIPPPGMHLTGLSSGRRGTRRGAWAHLTYVITVGPAVR